MFTKTKKFDWLAADSGLKSIPEVRKLVQQWAKNRNYQLVSISYTFEEEHQLLTHVTATYRSA